MQPQQQEGEKEEEEEIDLHQTPTSDNPDLQWPPGLLVQTPYGWGTVRRCRREEARGLMLEVRLEWHAVCYLPPTGVLDRAIVPLGACVLTTSGVGVVVGFRRTAAAAAFASASMRRQRPGQQHVYVVRLWNRIGCDGSVRLTTCIHRPPIISVR